jgi:hypothetical protein
MRYWAAAGLVLGIRRLWSEGVQVPDGWMVDSDTGRLKRGRVIRGNGPLPPITSAVDGTSGRGLAGDIQLWFLAQSIRAA